MIKKVSENLVQSYNDTVTVYTTNSYYGPNRHRFLKIDKEEEIIDGVQVKRFPFFRKHKPLLKYYSSISRKPIPSFLYKWNIGPISASLKSAMLHHDCDVIGASSIEYLFADYPLWRNKNKKPFVLYGGLHLEEGKAIHPQYLARIKGADLYIANTDYEKQVITAYGIDENKIKVTGCGTDIFCYEKTLNAKESLHIKYGLAENQRVLLYLGRQESLKGIDCLINAFENLYKEEPSLYLIIAGVAGSYTPYLQKIAYGDSSIRILNNVSEREKAELLQLSNMLILPSKYESFGIVFLEAWSFKKPVIGANIGAVASVIEDGKDGLLFEPGNVNDLTQKIKTFLQDSVLGSEMGAAGHEKVKKCYTWPIIAGKFRSVYELAVEKSHKSAVVSRKYA